MTAYPNFSAGDEVAPYLAYQASATLYIDAGGMQLPLAYKERLAGAAARPTSKLFQGREPTCTLAIEWAGVRRGAKPEPVKILTLGDFILVACAARVMSVSKETSGHDRIRASGYFLLASTTRPEDVVIPSFWAPYDGRYNTSVDQANQYLYTPADLGYGGMLPGQAASSPTYGNPKLANAAAGGNKILGVNP